MICLRLPAAERGVCCTDEHVLRRAPRSLSCIRCELSSARPCQFRQVQAQGTPTCPYTPNLPFHAQPTLPRPTYPSTPKPMPTASMCCGVLPWVRWDLWAIGSCTTLTSDTCCQTQGCIRYSIPSTLGAKCTLSSTTRHSQVYYDPI